MIFLAPFFYDFKILLRLVLGESLFLSLHDSSAHHCFCASDLYMLTAEPSSWLKVSENTLTSQISWNFTHTIVHGRWALTQRPINNKAGHSNTRTCTYTLKSIVNWSTGPRETTDTHTRARVRTHANWWETRWEENTHIPQCSIRWFVESGATNIRLCYAHLISFRMGIHYKLFGCDRADGSTLVVRHLTSVRAGGVLRNGKQFYFFIY